jgi:NAD(P)-dependent dehydrogenase (short-subunit alcohol dehydrogenase family)
VGQVRPAAAMMDSLCSVPLAAGLVRRVTPEEVAAAIVYLCTEEAQSVTGAVLSVDGGLSAGGRL